MGLMIDDGVGQGYSAKVTKRNQLATYTESASIQHYISANQGQAYQVIGDFATVNNSTHTVLHVKNSDSDRVMVVTYIRVNLLDFAGGTSVPNVATYFDIGFGRTVSSGGTAVTPVNMNRDSGNTASVTATDNNPTMAGTFTEIDRHYVQAEGQEWAYNKEGTVILGLNDTIEIRVTSDHTSGVAYARMSFIMLDPRDG